MAGPVYIYLNKCQKEKACRVFQKIGFSQTTSWFGHYENKYIPRLALDLGEESGTPQGAFPQCLTI